MLLQAIAELKDRFPSQITTTALIDAVGDDSSKTMSKYSLYKQLMTKLICITSCRYW